MSDFDESIDVTKTTLAGGSQTASNLGLWRHRRLEGRNGWSFQDRAAVLGWNTAGWTGVAPADAPSYTITLPDDLPTPLAARPADDPLVLPGRYVRNVRGAERR